MPPKKPVRVPREESDRGPRGGRLQRDPKAVLDVEDNVKARHPEDTQRPPKTKKNQLR
ncbi:MAG TPA: hypothetical protein VJ922_01280 [Actinomycetota bacterium]|nr:hypothetical protein [Actinomycetota bacterium]